MLPIKIDSYEQMTVQGAVRTGVPQFIAFRESLEGTKPFPAQTRILLEFVRRNCLTLEDLLALANRDRKVQP